jgi:AcrR family transcriptional regulator
MADKTVQAARKPRADAARNRALLLDTAKRVFAAKGPAASLDEIARTAGVGIGTLYRHFPTRDALVEETYRNEAMQLAAAAVQLSASLAPLDALRQWLFLFIDYFTTKKIIVAALSPATGTEALYDMSTRLLTDSVETLAQRAVQSGAIRLGMAPMDILRAIGGLGNFNAPAGWENNARRLVDVLITGMKVP